MSFKTGANSIIDDNLSILSNDVYDASERRLVQLYERAQLILRDESIIFGENHAEDFPALFKYTELPNDIPAQSTNYIATQRTNQILLDKLTVCKIVSEGYNKRVPLIDRLIKCETFSPSQNIAYFRNVYADAAFRAFSAYLENPTVTYVSDFNAVCEDVYYGRSDMCLLPLDNSRDSKLVSFYKLIEKYELFPIFSCDVAAPDGSVTTRYALLRRAPSLPDRSLRNVGNGCLFEFSVTPDDEIGLSDVLCAAKLCGLSVYKIDSLPSTYTEGTFTYDLILSVSTAEGLDAFVLFLTLCVPQYEPLGIYRHIRTET